MPEVTFAPSAEDVGGSDEALTIDTVAEAGDEGAEASTETIIKPEKVAVAPTADEEEARRFGWVPKDEFRGPPGKWRSAEDFLRINNESAPVLKERMRKLEEKHQADFARLERIAKASLEAQRQQFENERKAAIREATQAGDVEEVERLIDLKGPAVVENAPPVEVEAFVQRNPWFTANPAMHRVAVGIEEEIAQGRPDMSLTDRLAETERRMSLIYPEVVKGGGKSRLPLPPGEGGVRITPKRTLVEKLTPQERSMGHMFVEQGAYKSLDEYAAAMEEDTFVVGKKARA